MQRSVSVAAAEEQEALRTEFDFELPRGYLGDDGTVHRSGTMRLATARDELLPLFDAKVQEHAAWTTVVLLGRVITRLGTLPMALLRRFLDSDVITQSAALGFYAALSMAPLMLLLLWLTASSANAQGAVITQVGMLVGPEAQSVARTVLDQAASAPDTGSIAGWWSIALLLVGASAVFAQLQDALNRIFRTDATALPGLWNWVKKRMLSFGLVLAVVFLLVISMTLTTLLDLTIGRYAQGETVAATLAALLVYAFTFALMYHYLPDRRVRWRLSLAGGSFTAVLFMAGRAGIAWYLAHQGTASAYGAMGALVLTMLWVYYAAMILFAGAVVTATIDERRGPAPPP